MDVAADRVVLRPRQAENPVLAVAEDVALHQAVVSIACRSKNPFEYKNPKPLNATPELNR